MANYKYISTTLPYINSTPHIGHCFEFVLADVISEYHRLNDDNVFFNVGIDEHGQKVYQKAIDEGYTDTQAYCDDLSEKWKAFCKTLHINYDNFYRTTSAEHKKNVLHYFYDIAHHTFQQSYSGNYCVGCEAFITDKEALDGKCPVHQTALVSVSESNQFFLLSAFANQIADVLVDKSKSAELQNIIGERFDLSISRQNVKWGIEAINGGVFYVWFEALLNYIFAIRYYEDKEFFNNYWNNSLIICGKDNLKFQAYILQALLLANKVPQTKEVLVHGNILDAAGTKLSKSLGNVIDPIEQVEKYGVDAVRYYLVFGLNTFADSKYSEAELVQKWNNDIVNGLGNLISRLLHLIELRNASLNPAALPKSFLERATGNINSINQAFEQYNFKEVGDLLNSIVFNLNKRITLEKPFDKNCTNYADILNELYYELESVIPYYILILKQHKPQLIDAFRRVKKTIIFERISM